MSEAAAPTVRKIIHVDCDCFYAAVEMRDNPELRDRPIAVGGAGRRGVITTCNYPARRFGVRSAMPGGEALRLCPDLTLLPVDMPRYRAASQQVMAILRELTEWVEPLSLDEAYLDVSEVTAFKGSATLMAQHLRERVHREVGITLSAGVAPNKFLAKIASDWQKPDGLFVIRPDDVDSFVRKLPVEKIHGVGQVTARRLHDLSIFTCEDLRQQRPEQLAEWFGKQGHRLYRLAYGEDDRPVVVTREAKSVSVERTFAADLPNLHACQAVLPSLLDELAGRLSRRGRDKPVHKLFVKVRYSDFSTHTLERVRVLSGPPQVADYQTLLAELVTDAQRPVRLLGLGVRFHESGAPTRQLRLFD